MAEGREPRTFAVERDGDGSFWVRGLATDWPDPETDTLVLYHHQYPESEAPDVGAPVDRRQMLRALYDLFQVHEGLVEGDRFETPFGAFVCRGVHVVPEGGS